MFHTWMQYSMYVCITLAPHAQCRWPITVLLIHFSFWFTYVRMLHVLHMSCHGNVLCNFTIRTLHSQCRWPVTVHFEVHMLCVLHMFTGCCCALEDCCENKEDSIWGPKHWGTVFIYNSPMYTKCGCLSCDWALSLCGLLSCVIMPTHHS